MRPDRLAATPWLPLLLLGALGPACSGDDSAHARAAAGAVTIVDPPTGPYVPGDVHDGGTIVGTVSFAGTAPADTTIAITRDEQVCGPQLRQSSARTADGRIIDALVWIGDIRRGRPLPLTRRFELVQRGCVFTPRWQAVFAGGTLNVRTEDPITTRSVVVNTRTLDTLASLPFTAAGAVIPLDTPLREPAMLEVQSLTHPWMRAWVAVLDHPYVVSTDGEGSFRITDVPAGSYRVRAWHPHFGVVTDSVSVRPRGEDTLHLHFPYSARATTRSNAIATNSSARYSSE